MRRLRPGWSVLVVGTAVLAVAVLYRSSVHAQAGAGVVLATTLEVPVLSSLAAAVTGDPQVEDTVVGGTPALVVRPAGGGPAPALVFVNGATQHGRHHPTVGRLALGLARTGFLVVIHDPPGLARGEITERTLDSTLAVVRAVASRPDVRDARVGLLGVSVGASLALVAAAEPDVAGRVPVVAGIAPYADLREVIRLATTGSIRVDGRLVEHPAAVFLRLVVGRSLAASLPPGRDRDVLTEHMDAVAWESLTPLAALRESPPPDLGPEGQAVVRVLLNTDAERFDDLYAELPEEVRAGVRRLSPLPAADGIGGRVELASAPVDRYFPVDESRALVEHAPDSRLTVTGTLDHAVPRASLRGLVDLVRLDAFAVRVLRAARA